MLQNVNIYMKAKENNISHKYEEKNWMESKSKVSFLI